jgi:hypothetical protein
VKFKARLRQINKRILFTMSKSSGDRARAQECVVRIGGGLLSPVVVCRGGAWNGTTY